jgi:hypothetical protein
VNPNVIELNCTVFDCSSDRRAFNNLLLKHALKNCPKIRKIELMNSSNSFKLNKKRVSLPVQRLKRSWTDLVCIKSHNGFTCNEKTLKLILENFPNIESVIPLFYMCSGTIIFYFMKIYRELSIAVTELSQTGVDHLINMKRLHTLDFVDYRGGHFPHLIVKVAGEVPSLRNFGFRSAGDSNQNYFIEEFTEKYPKKELLVISLLYVLIFKLTRYLLDQLY